jgi:hypothetical protein
MKRSATLVLICLLALFVKVRVANAGDRVFLGEISDSQCAMNIHSLTRSHREMLQSKSMGGNATDCALYCVKYHGGEFVLSSKDEVLRLDNQDLARSFAGLKVIVTGTLLPDKKTIHVVAMSTSK